MASVALNDASFQVFRSPLSVTDNYNRRNSRYYDISNSNVGFLHDHGDLNAEGAMPITDLFLQPEKPVGIHYFPFCCWRKYMAYMTGV